MPTAPAKPRANKRTTKSTKDTKGATRKYSARSEYASCEITVAGDNSGHGYKGRYRITWDRPDGKLKDIDREAGLSQTVNITVKGAFTRAVTDACDYVLRVRTDHISDDQLNQIDSLLTVLRDWHYPGDSESSESSPPPLTAVGRLAETAEPIRRSSAMPAFNDPSAIDVSQETPASELSLEAELQSIDWEEAKVECDLIDRHPENRDVPIPSVADLADSIRTTGRLLERVKLRDLGDGRYQMISGERRWKATHLILGWETIDADVATMSDRAAGALLTICNQARKDLNDIEKARDIRRLTQPLDDGGTVGLTHEQAGEIYGISRSQASNLLRLLELPESVLGLVESGELPSTYARAVLPYAVVPSFASIVTAVVKEWSKTPTDEAGETERREARRESREAFFDHVGQEINEATRSMTAADVRKWYLKWSAEHEADRVFEPSDAERQKLGVVTIPNPWRPKETAEVATNAKLWDKLQKAALPQRIKEWEQLKTKQANKAAGGSKAAAKDKPLTAAEQRKRDDERRRQLAERIKCWRHAWLKELIAERLHYFPDVVERLRVWLQAEPFSAMWAGDLKLAANTVKHARGKTVNHTPTSWDVWQAIESISYEKLEDVARDTIRDMLLTEDRDPKIPKLSFQLVDRLALIAEISLAGEWLKTQTANSVYYDTFLALHDKAGLIALAKEWKCEIFEAEKLTKPQLIAKLTGQPRTFPIPKSIEPVGVTKKKGRKR